MTTDELKKMLKEQCGCAPVPNLNDVHIAYCPDRPIPEWQRQQERQSGRTCTCGIEIAEADRRCTERDCPYKRG